jgi:hypothetical protein
MELPQEYPWLQLIGTHLRTLALEAWALPSQQE